MTKSFQLPLSFHEEKKNMNFKLPYTKNKTVAKLNKFSLIYKKKKARVMYEKLMKNDADLHVICICIHAFRERKKACLVISALCCQRFEVALLNDHLHLR